MIEASRCPACQRTAIPPEPACLACGSPTREHELAPEGRVLTYTRNEEGWIALVELAGKARALATSPVEPAIGASHRLEATQTDLLRLAP